MADVSLWELIKNDIGINEAKDNVIGAKDAVVDWWDSLNTAQKVGMSPVGWPVTDIAGFAGDMQMYAEQPESRNMLNYIGTGIGLLPFAPAMSGVIKAKDAVKNSDGILHFLHNTSADKLKRFDEIGGMPMPSLAVTKPEIPFEGYGDITLIGKPSNFDPALKSNPMYSADAYTVRAPSPVRLAKKGAYKDIRADYADVANKYGVDTSDAQYSLGQLETKGDVNASDMNDIESFFNHSAAAKAKFLQSIGEAVPVDQAGRMDGYATSMLIGDKYKNQHADWVRGQLDKYLEPDKYFIANPNRDYYTTRARLKPYTADEVTKFMKSRAGVNQEGGPASSGFGSQRASTVERIKSLSDARARAGAIQPRDAILALEDKQKADFFKIAEDLQPYYKYDGSGFTYLDEVSDLVKQSEKIGIHGALNEVGFDDVPVGVIDEITAYKDSLRNAPTQYFETKPTRTVDLSEFGGAIIPKDTPPEVVKLLEDAKIKIEVASTPEEAMAARNKFKELLFSLGLIAPTGLMGYMALDQQDTGAM